MHLRRGKGVCVCACACAWFTCIICSLSTVSLTLSTLYAVSVSTLYFALDNLLDMSDELPVKVKIP